MVWVGKNVKQSHSQQDTFHQPRVSFVIGLKVIFRVTKWENERAGNKIQEFCAHKHPALHGHLVKGFSGFSGNAQGG